ncbi:hypothetical protein RFI_39181 [Reticulomyxa filosa]|uniref:Uncharacterized protein n=1 Tax=Reticulomyxa filosa TaxID=46433 RepID=X6LB24_RETFI|nr:hypothetical protein RFI_39181 [Reticulomyxa filosa]|eukprot:ETN98331.1 hypothetical protein RFI_39181 [Reticulomyxa filosa]
MTKDFEEMAKKALRNGPHSSSRGSVSNKNTSDNGALRNLQAPLAGDSKRSTLPPNQPTAASVLVDGGSSSQNPHTGTDQKRHTIAVKPNPQQVRKAKKLQAQQEKNTSLPKIQSELSQNDADGLTLQQTKTPSVFFFFKVLFPLYTYTYDVIASMAEENLNQFDDEEAQAPKSHEIAFQHIRKKSSKQLEKEKAELNRVTPSPSDTPQPRTSSPVEPLPLSVATQSYGSSKKQKVAICYILFQSP